MPAAIGFGQIKLQQELAISTLQSPVCCWLHPDVIITCGTSWLAIDADNERIFSLRGSNELLYFTEQLKHAIRIELGRKVVSSDGMYLETAHHGSLSLHDDSNSPGMAYIGIAGRMLQVDLDWLTDMLLWLGRSCRIDITHWISDDSHKIDVTSQPFGVRLAVQLENGQTCRTDLDPATALKLQQQLLLAAASKIPVSEESLLSVPGGWELVIRPGDQEHWPQLELLDRGISAWQLSLGRNYLLRLAARITMALANTPH